MGETRLSKLILFGEMMKKIPAADRPRRDFVSNKVLMDGMNCVRIGTVVIMQRCQEGISQLRITICKESICAASKQLKGGRFTYQCGRTFCRAGDCTRHS